MILTCPSCHARFSVADRLIPEGGRTVRCSKCTHAWHVERTSFSSALEAATPVVAEIVMPGPATPAPEPAARARPALNRGRRAADKLKAKNPRPYKIAAPVFAVCWLAMAFVAYSPSWSRVPGLSSLYAMVGAVPTEGLAFADISMTREQEGSKTKFILAGVIRNTTKEARQVPTVRVLLKDKNNNTLWGREYPVNTALKAGETYPFRISNVETAFAKNVARIVVDMGNSMQLMVR